MSDVSRSRSVSRSNSCVPVDEQVDGSVNDGDSGGEEKKVGRIEVKVVRFKVRYFLNFVEFFVKQFLS